MTTFNIYIKITMIKLSTIVLQKLNYCILNKIYLSRYFKKINVIIYNILSHSNKEEFTFDILDSQCTIENKLLILREKQRQMKIGNLWQDVLGNYKGFKNLKTADVSGLDIVSHKHKIIIELKNRTTTDNYSSKKSNINKLIKFKKENLEYKCIYACINGNTQEQTMSGSIKKILYDDVEIEFYIGLPFLKFIYGKNVYIILDFIKYFVSLYDCLH